MPPQLLTERLVMSAHTRDDFDECAAMWGDADVTRYIGGRPFSREEVWSRILRYAGLWTLLGFGYWAVREREGGRFVGDVGFADFHRDIMPSLGNSPEAGWALAPWAHGQGFATEALNAALTWGDAQLPSTPTAPARFVCLIAPENARSARVAEKCGFHQSARGTYKEHPTIIYERPVAPRVDAR